MREQFANAFCEIANKDPRLAMLVADISPSVPSLLKFREAFPDQFLNVGVSEQIMIGMAAGMALRGMRPFAYTIATFALYRPFEFIRDDLAYQNLSVTVVGAPAGVAYSVLGSTHHAMEDVAIASAIPNLSVVAPCDPAETRDITLWCAQQSEGPVYLRIGKMGEPNYTDKAVDSFIPGKLRYICRGKDTCIIAYGPIIQMAFELRETKLKSESVSIVSCHTIKPLDLEGLNEIFKNHKRVIVIEEHVPHGGLGSRIKTFAWDNKIDRELQCFSLKDEFIHFFGSHQDLLKQHQLSIDCIEL